MVDGIERVSSYSIPPGLSKVEVHFTVDGLSPTRELFFFIELLRNFERTIERFQLEAGDVATAWTPHPEDGEDGYTETFTCPSAIVRSRFDLSGEEAVDVRMEVSNETGEPAETLSVTVPPSTGQSMPCTR